MLPVFQIPGPSHPSRSPAAPEWRFPLILVSGKGVRQILPLPSRSPGMVVQALGSLPVSAKDEGT